MFAHVAFRPRIFARRGFLCHASEREDPSESEEIPKRFETKVNKRWMEKGYFAVEDPNAPIRSRRNLASIPDVLDSNELIWNTKWQEKMDAVERDEERKRNEAEERTRPQVGFLSFHRLDTLQDLQLDLSTELRTTGSKVTDARVVLPDEMDIPIQQEKHPSGHAEAQMDPYEEDARALVSWTLGLTAICSVLVFLFYKEDCAASYALGAAFGLIYFVMLSTSIAGVGSTDLVRKARSLLGQPRILLPVLMVVLWKKWDGWIEHQLGLHLQITFMFAGFFTYQIATFAQVVREQRR